MSSDRKAAPVSVIGIDIGKLVSRHRPRPAWRDRAPAEVVTWTSGSAARPHTAEPDRYRGLASFDIELYCDGGTDRGHSSNVLGGPLSAVRHLLERPWRDPDNPPLAAGEIVTSGTLTRALPVKAGETWTTKLKGIGLEGVSLRFC
jgi:hypothetical protein